MNILAVGCHPDDIEIACSGTLAKYVKMGHKVFMCHIANGDMGHVVIMPDELAKVRKVEAEKAAAIIGAEAITLDVGDGKVDSHNRETIKKLIEVIRYAKPDVIITHNPEDYMTDHMETSKLAFNASFLSSLPHYEAGGEPFPNIPPIYYMDTVSGINFVPTEYVDISDTIETKLEALSCHESQLKWMYDHDNIDFKEFVKTCSRARGFQCGVDYAEGFRPCLAYLRMRTSRLLP